jgi:hypothetical protein
MSDASAAGMDEPEARGLRCHKCGHGRFAVIYTRQGSAGAIVRRRECRQCGTRITTVERTVGGWAQGLSPGTPSPSEPESS